MGLVETRAAPGRSEALAGLKSTPKRDMSEIMCFVKPPRAMSILATVVCLLVGGDRLSASQFEKKLAKLQKLEDKKKLGWQEFRRLSDPYWALFKRFDAINLSVLPFRCVRCAAQHLFKSNNRWASFRNDLIKCWGPGPPLYDCVASVLRAAALHQLSRDWAVSCKPPCCSRSSCCSTCSHTCPIPSTRWSSPGAPGSRLSKPGSRSATRSRRAAEAADAGTQAAS